MPLTPPAGAAHGAHFGFAEEDGLAVVAGEEDHLPAVGEFRADQFVLVVEIDGDDAGRARIGKFGEARFSSRCRCGWRGRRSDSASSRLRAETTAVSFSFSWKRTRLRDGFAARGCGGFGNFIDLQPVDAALGSEQQNVAVRGGDEEMLDEIVFAGFGTDAALAAARLVAIDVHRGALHVARMADGDGHFLVFDEVFELDFLDAVDDLCAALVAIGFNDFAQFGDDDGVQLLFAGENFASSAMRSRIFFNSARMSSIGKLRQAVQLQFEDGVNLRKAEADDLPALRR